MLDYCCSLQLFDDKVNNEGVMVFGVGDLGIYNMDFISNQENQKLQFVVIDNRGVEGFYIVFLSC